MIYFLVNNNYHLIDALSQVENLNSDEVSLITVNHTLDITKEHEKIFTEIFTFNKAIEKSVDYINIRKSIKNKKAIKNGLNSINHHDVIFFYAELELQNHYIVELFKTRGAQVFLIEEGLATYITFFSEEKIKKYKTKALIKEILIRYVLLYKNSRVRKNVDFDIVTIRDQLIDGALFFGDVKNNQREIKTYTIEKNCLILDKTEEAAVIFLNQDIYAIYVSFDEYLYVLNDILCNLANNFKKVYFKFHPRENEEIRSKIKENIKSIDSISFIKSNHPIENDIEKLSIKNACSFMSNSLLNLSHQGINPIFVIHKYENLSKDKTLNDCIAILEVMGYDFFQEWSDLKRINNAFFINKAKKYTTDINYLSFHQEADHTNLK